MQKKILSFVLRIFTIAVLFCAACSTDPLRDRRVLTPPPEKYLIEGVPIYQQGYKECGPTSLQMVLNFYGKKVTREEIIKSITMFSWGTPVSEMERYAKSQGFEVYSFYGPNLKKMKQLIAQGYPLIALGEIPSNWYPSGSYAGTGHYVVVVGYNDETQKFIINDPGPGHRMTVHYAMMKEFLSSLRFASNCNYVLCIYPKEK